MAETAPEKAARLNAARLEQSRRAAGVYDTLHRPAQPAPLKQDLEWWQREKKRPTGPPGGPKAPSWKQYALLAMELGYDHGDGAFQPATRSEVRGWVRMANAYYPGPYTSIHFVLAIDLIKRGRNVLGTIEQLVAYSWGEELPPPESMATIFPPRKKKRA